MSRKGVFTETNSDGGGNKGSLNEHEGSFGKDENILKLSNGYGCTTVESY